MYPTLEEIQIQMGVVRKNYQFVNFEKGKEEITRDVLFAIFSLASKNGRELFSLHQKDLENYLPNLKILLCDWCHLSSQVFLLTEDNHYANFLDFVEKKIVANGFGTIDRHNAILCMDVPPFYLHKYLNYLKYLEDVIVLGSELLLQEIPTCILQDTDSLKLKAKF